MFHRSRNVSRLAPRPLVEQLEDRCVPANAAPIIMSLNAEVTTASGSMVLLRGTFEDADVNDPHSVIVSWNDNTPDQKITLAPGATQFQVSHLYANRPAALANLRSIGVIVTDQAFATQVVASSGDFDNSAFRMTGSVLGEPTRFTDPTGPFGGAVTPFNAPFGANEIITLNDGESITVEFPVEVFDRPASEHFGADFLVFGNAFYHLDFNTGKATGGVFEEPGMIEVSQDGITFFEITSSFADTAFPTNGYRNPTGPFDLPPTDPLYSDFGLPVPTTFEETGLTTSQIVAAYNGSGGGTPVDISETGLDWIKFVRVTGAINGVEIDAFSVVNPLPEPVTVGEFNLSPTDETLGLYVDSTGVFQSADTSVKWLRGGTANAHGNTWYFLRQDGDSLAWNGKTSANGQKLARGTIVAHFDPQIFVQPKLLYQSSLATLTGADADQVRDLDEDLGLFVGVDGFRHGSLGKNVKWLRGVENDAGNTWYFIDRDGGFFEWSGKPSATGTLRHTFDPQLFLDPHLLYDASEATLTGLDATQAQDLDAAIGLFVDADGFFPKVQGTDAKWLRGQPNVSENPWYFIRSNGEFVVWDGSKTAGGKKIASGEILHDFTDQLFRDPHLLFSAAQPSLPAEQIVQARLFQANLGLFVDVQGFFPNERDTSAKWFRGQPNEFGKTWYFIRENGEFVAWNGQKDSRGRMVADGTALFQFDAQVFRNPEPLL